MSVLRYPGVRRETDAVQKEAGQVNHGGSTLFKAS
jgi:hypothetical protein